MELMRYFKCADPLDTRFGPLSEAVASCKNNEKEIDYMCNLVQEYAQEYSKHREELAKAEGKAEGENKKAVEVVRNLLNRGIKLEEAFLIANIDAKTYNDYSAGL